MTTHGCLVLQTATGWQISRTDEAAWQALEGGADLSAEELAQQVDAYVQQQSLPRDKILLAAGVSDALAATIDVQEGDARHRRTLCYELESVLPWAAEQTVADFVVEDHHALAVAVNVDRWMPFVLALETRRLMIQSISAAAMLAVHDCSTESWFQRTDGILWCEESTSHVVRLQKGHPATWRVIGTEPSSALVELAAESSSAPTPQHWTIVNANPEEWDSIALPEHIDATYVNSDTMAERVRHAAGRVLGGQWTPWFELRRDELAVGDPRRSIRRAARVLAVCAALLILSWIGTFGYRAFVCTQKAEAYFQQEAEVYRQAFPGSRVPGAVLSRLRSEHTRRFAARQAPSDIPLPVPALSVLRDFLDGLPDRERVRVRELRIENGQLDLDADLRTHAAANVLADSLRKRGFEVAEPPTEQNEDHSVSTRLFARWATAEPTKKGARP